ncbi:response regulator [Tautonia plasticadhaerens]|uniref:Transcriptional regulatory protein DegU n=1 Tax=Tautonia plasticadhaerens TaxID=2527974 RepID=A0A518GZF0_9BACT|nr:response regulator [Tautonia plasticadhaerens]QDV33932.1 Transcriptional regulatory protein DegU [Tautonia plasticadhaerens]
MDPLRVIVVDDSPVMLRSMARLLVGLPGVQVVARAASGVEALEASGRLRPDLVLIDLAMPGMDGLEASRRHSAASDAPTVILTTVHDLPEYREAALAAGALDLLIKSELGRLLGPALRLVPRRPADGPRPR